MKDENDSTVNKDAARLLFGVREDKTDSNWIFQKRMNLGITVVGRDRLITCNLQTLLGLQDPKIEPFNVGKDLFLTALQTEKTDLLSSTPLAYAYFWTLACESALTGRVRFDSELEFKIKCKQLKKYRSFKDHSTELDLDCVKQMKSNVMYYADEPKPYPSSEGETSGSNDSHPIADLFFVTEDDELVLIDVTGGNQNTVQTKMTEKAKSLKANGDKGDGKEIRCIILAPNMDETVKREGEGVDVVHGRNAIRSLRGLGQILPWLVEDEKKQEAEASKVT